jgi:CDP-glucose 4,6-dehydratase
VAELTELFIEAWGSGAWVNAHDPSAVVETHVLRLTIDKAVAELPWRPRLSAREAIRRTASWFRAFTSTGTSCRELCETEIRSYESLEFPTARLPEIV